MIALALDSNNDLALVNGQILRVTQAEQVVQHVRTRLLFYLGEWFLDTSAGVPYFQEIFLKPANIANVESRIKAQIIETPEVESLTSFSLDFNKTTRVVRIFFEARTIYGDISDSIPLNV